MKFFFLFLNTFLCDTSHIIIQVLYYSNKIKSSNKELKLYFKLFVISNDGLMVQNDIFDNVERTKIGELPIQLQTTYIFLHTLNNVFYFLLLIKISIPNFTLNVNFKLFL